MARAFRLTMAVAVALAPTVALAAPPASGSISPAHQTGQPDQSCEDLGNQPGQAQDAPGQGSAFAGDSSIAGSVYAGNRQGINDKNTASVSQYDVACLHNQSNDPQPQP
jgi:hypothetical protein